MAVTALPMIVGLYFGRYVLRMNPVLLLGALAGSQTMTAAMAAVQDRSESSVAVLGFTPAVSIRPYPAYNVGHRDRWLGCGVSRQRPPRDESRAASRPRPAVPIRLRHPVRDHQPVRALVHLPGPHACPVRLRTEDDGQARRYLGLLRPCGVAGCRDDHPGLLRNLASGARGSAAAWWWPFPGG